MSMKGKLPIIFQGNMGVKGYFSTINKIEGKYYKWDNLYRVLWNPNTSKCERDRITDGLLGNALRIRYDEYTEYMRQANRVRPRSKMMKQIILTDRKPNNQVKP